MTLSDFVVGVGVLFLIGIVGGSLASIVSPVETDTVKIIDYHPGGAVHEYYTEYAGWARDDVKVIFNGPCISACTLVLGFIPPADMCATDLAHFEFHEVTARGFYDKPATEWFYDFIPHHIKDLLNDKGWDMETGVNGTDFPGGMIYLTPAEVGVQSCDGVEWADAVS